MFTKEISIAIGADHGGYTLKQFLIYNLQEAGYTLKDYGTDSEKSVDYPDIAHPLAKDISTGKMKVGILICGTGNGISMTANKYKNVRAALCWRTEIAELARLHNDANIIALPGRFIDFEIALEMVKLFLNTSFEGGRHLKRIEKINI
ncbi:MAG: ribose 5-phosphate isomerase B [Bacteroidales bacterium]